MSNFYMKQKEINLDSVEIFPSPNGTLIIRTLGITEHEQTIEISKEFFVMNQIFRPLSICTK